MSEADMTALLSSHKWPAVAMVVIWFAMQLVKDDNRFPIAIPADKRVYLLFALGVASGVLEHVLAGQSWSDAAIGAVVSIALPMFFHEGVVEAARGGKNIPLPWLTIPGASPSPGAPATIPPKQKAETILPPTDEP